MATIPNHVDLPQHDLTIYPLSESVTEDQVVATLPDLTEFEVNVGRSDGRLFVERNRRPGPSWTDFFEGQVAAGDLGAVSSVSAVFLLRVSNRLFVLTFGSGRFLLDDDWFEDRFGFYAVLNLVDSGQIWSVDKRSLDTVGRQTRVQMARGTTVREFGVDYERDLLRAVVGKPREEDLGQRVTGTASLRATVRVDLAHLPRLLAKYLDESTATRYRRKFPGIDQLKVVADEAQVSRLDRFVVEALIAGDVDTFTLAVPEIIDWQQVSEFRFDGLHDGNDHHELRISDLVQLAVADDLAWTDADLRRIKIRVLDADGVQRGRWSLRHCLFGQCEFQRKQWVLSSGTWYSVAGGLVDEVNETFAQLERMDGLCACD